MSSERTQFGYLLDSFECACQARNPYMEGYADKRKALFAYVRELEAGRASALPQGISSFRSAQELAQRFHAIYERLAPDFGYTTRHETRTFDLQSANGRLMVAACQELLAAAPAVTAPQDVMRQALEARESLFMCKVDWDHELGNAAGGTELYGDIDDLKQCRVCVAGCGIVEVRAELVRVVDYGRESTNIDAAISADPRPDQARVSQTKGGA